MLRWLARGWWSALMARARAQGAASHLALAQVRLGADLPMAGTQWLLPQAVVILVVLELVLGLGLAVVRRAVEGLLLGAAAACLAVVQQFQS